jgi:hypothetical protein
MPNALGPDPSSPVGCCTQQDPDSVAVWQPFNGKGPALGQAFTNPDLANYHGEWQEGATTNYHDYDFWELPPPSQAWNTLEILNILEVCVPQWVPGQTLASLGPTSPVYWHLMIAFFLRPSRLSSAGARRGCRRFMILKSQIPSTSPSDRSSCIFNSPHLR